MPLPPDIAQRYQSSPDHGLDIWMARKVFNAVGLRSRKDRLRLRRYYLQMGFVARAGEDLPIAIFALKRVLQAGYGGGGIPISDFLAVSFAQSADARSWYVRTYPKWDGQPPAALARIGSAAKVMYALEAARLLGRHLPFCAYPYLGEGGGGYVYLISQELTAFVGPAADSAAATLQPLLGGDDAP